MPPTRSTGGRASKACDTCRKFKTRCHPSGLSSRICLRCTTLNLKCSLQESPENLGAPEASSSVKQSSDIERRITDLERSVQRLNSILDSESDVVTDDVAVDIESPLTVIQNATFETRPETGPPVRRQAKQVILANIIEQGFISANDANDLLGLFSRHYKRWITFREAEDLFLKVEDIASPLLLCVCCLIAVRHSIAANARDMAGILYHEATSLLEKQILLTPQPLEFFQAVLLLSLWSTTVGHKPLSIDGWLITGFALQHRFACDAFNADESQSQNDPAGDRFIGPKLLTVRLCLSHLHSSVSMRRRSMLSRPEIETMINTVTVEGLSNYEARMIAELELYSKIYDHCIALSVDLPRAQVALQHWKQKWEQLLAQPRSQFMQMGSQFAQLLMYEQGLSNRSAAARESFLSEMVMLSSGILHLAMATTDERTKHLTDHIYHIIAFAAITLCRLAHKYETHLAVFKASINVDHLLTETVDWLRSLGTPLHIGNLMGNVITNAHRKLRPEMQTSLVSGPMVETPVLYENAFVDLIGSNGLDCDWDAMFCDWQFFSSDGQPGSG